MAWEAPGRGPANFSDRAKCWECPMKLCRYVFLLLTVVLFCLPSPAQVEVTAPAVKLVPTSLTFGRQVIGTVSSSQNVTLTNSGTAPLSLTRIQASGGCREKKNCGTRGKEGESCTSAGVIFPPVSP